MLTLPQNNQSLWREAYPGLLYPQLSTDIKVDVAIVGAGITGLTAAYLLKRAGCSVAVLDKASVGGGTTGRTTGKVTSQHSLVYTDLQKRLGRQAALIYGEANQAAISQIEAIIEREKISCDWQRDDNFVFTSQAKQVELFRQEAKVAADLGLPATFETSIPLPFKVAAAVKFKNQAKFNSQKYLLGLAAAINGQGSYVFEASNVIGIRDGNPGRVRTARGRITARSIIVASSVPTLPLAARGGYGVLEYPSESYIVAGQMEQNLTGMYISPDKHHYSILPIEIEGEKTLLIGGEGHFWGLRGNREARFNRLAKYAQEHFGVSKITHRWSDRDYLAYDNIPLVGKLYPWSKNLYVGTAFKKWGLSNGTVAGMILCDAILGQKNGWSSTFRSMRLSPIKALPSFLSSQILGKD